MAVVHPLRLATVRKIRVLFTIPNFDTAGSGRALLNIAKGLNPEQFEPHIACLHDRGDFFQVVKASGIPVHVFPFVSPTRPVPALLQAAWKVSRRFKAIKPDIIHSFHYSADYTEPLAARMAGIPWVFTKKNMSWGGTSANAWKLRSFLAKSIAVQNTDMQRQFYPNSTKTVLIPRGVDTKAFAPQRPDPDIRLQMQTPAGKRIVICVANMVPVKGIELLIEAFAQLAPQFPDWMLWLVGEDKNEYGQKLHRMVEEKKLNSVVKFAGKQPNVRAFLDHAEIFVLPTKDKGEGSPVALLEAMANGKVVIGSNVPGIKDQLSNHPDLQFSAGSISQLQQRLSEKMSLKKYALNQTGERLREVACSQFTVDIEVKRHEAFYTLNPAKIKESINV